MPISSKPKTKKNRRILVVEDERPLAHALKLKLSNHGLDVTIASDGNEGLKAALSGGYDLILLDLLLPGIDGFAILEQIHSKKSKTPIVVLSNLGQPEDQQRAKELGAVQYCVKANTPLSVIIDLILSILR